MKDSKFVYMLNNFQVNFSTNGSNVKASLLLRSMKSSFTIKSRVRDSLRNSIWPLQMELMSSLKEKNSSELLPLSIHEVFPQA